MLQAALEGSPEFMLSTIDIDRPAPHYAVDTLTLLQKKHPNSELVYLMGGDSLRALPTWHDPVGFVAGWLLGFGHNFVTGFRIFVIRTKHDISRTRHFLDHI